MYNNCMIHTDMYVHVYIIYILIYLSTYTCAYNIHVCGHLYIYIYMFVFARLDAGCFCCLGNQVCRFAAPSRIDHFLVFDLFAKEALLFIIRELKKGGNPENIENITQTQREILSCLGVMSTA